MEGASLTWREREVECLVVKSMTAKQIAEYLHISPHTAERHLEHIKGKRGISSRQELTRVQPRTGDFVGYVGPRTECRDKTWEIYDFENDTDGYRIAVLIDPDYDAESDKPEPLLYVRDLGELFVLDKR